MPNFEDLTNQKFNMLHVDSIHSRNKYGKILYNCTCECGNKVIVLGTRIKNHRTKSCGCILNKKRAENAKLNGMHNTRIYSIWKGMIDRCDNPNNQSFKDYGGRGISVYSDWKGTRGFYNFLAWSLDNGYLKNLTIDRINNNGNYEPNNCRWTDWGTQAKNRRRPIKVKNQYGTWNYRALQPYKEETL